MKHKKLRLLLQVFKNANLHRLIVGYLIFFALTALVIRLFEPNVPTYGDASWYCFVSCTTIGFGDFTAVTAIGRIVTVLLYLYTVLLLAIVTAVLTQYFMEFAKAQKDESVALFLNDLEHLPDLSRERLEELSAQVRKRRNK